MEKKETKLTTESIEKQIRTLEDKIDVLRQQYKEIVEEEQKKIRQQKLERKAEVDKAYEHYLTLKKAYDHEYNEPCHYDNIDDFLDDLFNGNY